MCGRVTLTIDFVDYVENMLEAKSAPGFQKTDPRYNIAPGQFVPTIVSKDDGKRYLTNALWGFVTPWGDQTGKVALSQANIRDSTIAKNKFFTERLINNRCAVVVDGFYEWKTTDITKNTEQNNKLHKKVKKTPYRVVMKNRQPFVLAGLWRSIKTDNGTIITTGIITTNPNVLLSQVHNRMPVVLDKSTFDIWLNPAVKEFHMLHKLLVPFSSEAMEMYVVTSLVNNSRFDSPECIIPA